MSNSKGQNLSHYKVLVIDSIGYLTRLYSYAAIAYVGGGMGTNGLHNILEPAVFGLPIVIGKNFEKFEEAKELKATKGLYAVATAEEASALLTKLVTDQEFRMQTGLRSQEFVSTRTGATAMIVSYCETIL